MTLSPNHTWTAEETFAVAGGLSADSPAARLHQPPEPCIESRRPPTVGTDLLPPQIEYWMAEIAFIADWLGLFFCGTVYSDQSPADKHSKAVLISRRAEHPSKRTSG